jgi:DNA topoisomerase-1
MPRLRRTSSAQPGWTRRRAGRGFVYLDSEGRRLPPEAVARIKAMAIPPAWRDVWICPWPQGHLQAVGTDDAGRRQYLYHEHWRRIRDRQKYERALVLAQRLPAARAVVAGHLEAPGMPRERALATAFRLLDLGALRIGGERYAEAHSSYGLATLRRDHVTLVPGGVRISFTGKGGKDQEISVPDRQVRAAIRVLLRRDDPSERLLAWRDEGGWHEVSSADINAYIHEVTGTDVSAKDFRTWHGTALAAAGLAAWAAGNAAAASPGMPGTRPRRAVTGARATARAGGRNGGSGAGRRSTAETRATSAARRRAVAAAVRDVADHLGNTPTVARTSYIDPRVVERFLDGAAMPAPPAAVAEDKARASAEAPRDRPVDGARGPSGRDAMEEFELALLGWLTSE